MKSIMHKISIIPLIFAMTVLFCFTVQLETSLAPGVNNPRMEMALRPLALDESVFGDREHKQPQIVKYRDLMNKKFWKEFSSHRGDTYIMEFITDEGVPYYLTISHGKLPTIVEIAIQNGKVQRGSVLLYRDSHHDLLDLVTAYHIPKSAAEATTINYNINNHISTLVFSGAIDEIYWVVPGGAHFKNIGAYVSRMQGVNEKDVGPEAYEGDWDQIFYLCEIEIKNRGRPDSVSEKFIYFRPIPPKENPEVYLGLAQHYKYTIGEVREIQVHRRHDNTIPDLRNDPRQVIVSVDGDSFLLKVGRESEDESESRALDYGPIPQDMTTMIDYLNTAKRGEISTRIGRDAHYFISQIKSRCPTIALVVHHISPDYTPADYIGDILDSCVTEFSSSGIVKLPPSIDDVKIRIQTIAVTETMTSMDYLSAYDDVSYNPGETETMKQWWEKYWWNKQWWEMKATGHRFLKGINLEIPTELRKKYSVCSMTKIAQEILSRIQTLHPHSTIKGIVFKEQGGKLVFDILPTKISTPLGAVSESDMSQLYASILRPLAMGEKEKRNNLPAYPGDKLSSFVPRIRYQQGLDLISQQDTF